MTTDTRLTTDERLKYHLATQQKEQERMCADLLGTDPRFHNVQPVNPTGGQDGGIDITAITQDGIKVLGAVGFVTEACDSTEQRRRQKNKFKTDLDKAAKYLNEYKFFIFFTNINFTPKVKETLKQEARDRGFQECEIWGREKLRQNLDCPKGYSIRHRYLGILMNDAEQIDFWNHSNNEINKTLSTGFDNVQDLLARLEFLIDSQSPIEKFQVIFTFNEKIHTLSKSNIYLIIDLMLSTRPFHEHPDLYFLLAPNNITDHPLYEIMEHKTLLISRKLYWQTEGSRTKRETKWKKQRQGSCSEYKWDSLALSFTKKDIDFPLLIKELDQTHFCIYVNKSFSSTIESIQIVCDKYELTQISKPEMSFTVKDLTWITDASDFFAHKPQEEEWISLPRHSFGFDFSHRLPKKIR